MEPFASSGQLPSSRVMAAGSGQNRLASALCLKLSLNPGQMVEIPLVISWDFPYYEFEKSVIIVKMTLNFWKRRGECPEDGL